MAAHGDLYACHIIQKKYILQFLELICFHICQLSGNQCVLSVLSSRLGKLHMIMVQKLKLKGTIGVPESSHSNA